MASGQSAQFTVIIAEQDNKDTTDILSACTALGTTVPTIPNPYVMAAGVAVSTLCGAIPAGHIKDDVIGVFGVQLANRGGRLRTVWLPAGDISFNGGEQGATTSFNQPDSYEQTIKKPGESSSMGFSFKGTSASQYSGRASTTILARSIGMARRYIGRELAERCGEVLIYSWSKHNT